MIYTLEGIKNQISRLITKGEETVGLTELTLTEVVEALIAGYGLNTSDADFTAADLLIGKVGYNADGRVMGTMPIYGGETLAEVSQYTENNGTGTTYNISASTFATHTENNGTVYVIGG